MISGLSVPPGAEPGTDTPRCAPLTEKLTKMNFLGSKISQQIHSFTQYFSTPSKLTTNKQTTQVGNRDSVYRGSILNNASNAKSKPNQQAPRNNQQSPDQPRGSSNALGRTQHSHKSNVDLPNRNLHIAHVNIRGLYKESKGVARQESLIGLMLQDDIALCSVAEHNISATGDKPEHMLFDWEGSYRTNNRGGTGILIAKHLHSRNISNNFNSPTEFTAVTFSWKKEIYLIVSIYLPQWNNSKEMDANDRLFQQIRNQGKKWDNIIILGDFNAWNLAWGDRTNDRGTRLMRTITDADLGVCRLPGPTRIHPSRGRDTYVDLAISNHTEKIREVQLGPQFSDHRLIHFLYQMNDNNSSKKWVVDYKKTFQTAGNQIQQQMSLINPATLFNQRQLKNLPDIANTVIQQTWETHASWKIHRSDPKPWFTLRIRALRSETRFWQRQIRKFDNPPSLVHQTKWFDTLLPRCLQYLPGKQRQLLAVLS